MEKIIYIQDGNKKRKATPDELTQFEKDRLEAEAQASLIEAETTKKQADRESAMAKLSKLGLTEDEIAALVP